MLHHRPNSVTSFRWPQMSPPWNSHSWCPLNPRTSGHLGFPCLQTPPILFWGFSVFQKLPGPAVGSELSGAPRTNGFQELVFKCPSALVPGWMVSLTPVLCSILEFPVGYGAPGSHSYSRSLFLPPSSVSCHPTPLPPHLGVRFWNTYTQTYPQRPSLPTISVES